MSERECFDAIMAAVKTMPPAVQAQVHEMCNRVTAMGLEYNPVVLPLSLALMGSLYQLEVAKREAAGDN